MLRTADLGAIIAHPAMLRPPAVVFPSKSRKQGVLLRLLQHTRLHRWRRNVCGQQSQPPSLLRVKLPIENDGL